MSDDICAYHAAPGFARYVYDELGLTPENKDSRYTRYGDLIVVRGTELTAYWVRTIWREAFTASFGSISEAARLLRSIQRNWAVYQTASARRASLIAEALPPLSDKPKTFPCAAPDNPMGAFTLLDDNTLLASARCSSPWPNGRVAFVDDKLGPPSRAYKKLWEALALLGTWPKAGERCIDAGASPGGWTWALARLGAEVTAIDRAPLSDTISCLPNVRFIKHNAFTLTPSELGQTDWLFSDVVCYPEALYKWVQAWLDSGLARAMVCTIKMQGDDWDKQTVRRFASIPGSTIRHLWHNKHELTWMYMR